MTVDAELSRSSYVSLTTYRKDGTPVTTPVWHAADGAEMVVVSDADAGKVKRIRRNGAVEVTVCNMRGKIAPGAPSAKGTARVLDDAGTARARGLIARKYVMSRVGNWLSQTLRLRKPPVIGISIRF